MEKKLTVERLLRANSYINELVNSNFPTHGDYEEISAFFYDLPNYSGGIPEEILHSFVNASHLFLSKIIDYQNSLCKSFDSINTVFVLNKQYAVSIEAKASDYEVLLIAIECIRICFSFSFKLSKIYPSLNESTRKTFIHVVGRSLFLYGDSFIKFGKELSDYQEKTLQSIVTDTILIAISQSWNIDDSYLLKALILNLLETSGLVDKKDISLTQERVRQRLDMLSLAVDNISDYSLKLIIERFVEFNQNGRQVTLINSKWAMAFIYKKSIGFILCKNIKRTNNPGELPYTMDAYSPSFRDCIKRKITNGDKVILLDANESRRSSSYIPIQDSFFYNSSTMKFE